MGKTLSITVCLKKIPTTTTSSTNPHKSPFLSNEPQGMESEEGQIQIKWIVCLSAVILPIYWNYVKFTPDSHRSSDENMDVQNSVKEKMPEILFFKVNFCTFDNPDSWHSCVQETKEVEKNGPFQTCMPIMIIQEKYPSTDRPAGCCFITQHLNYYFIWPVFWSESK